MINDKKYQVYLISARWDQNDFKNNGTSFRRMYKKEVTDGFVKKESESWWNNYVNEKELYKKGKLKDYNPILKELKVEFLERSNWCLTWFSHYSYNIELSNKDLLKSFRNFVLEKQIQNERNGHYNNDKSEYSDLPYYCLMGAVTEIKC